MPPSIRTGLGSTSWRSLRIVSGIWSMIRLFAWSPIMMRWCAMLLNVALQRLYQEFCPETLFISGTTSPYHKSLCVGQRLHWMGLAWCILHWAELLTVKSRGIQGHARFYSVSKKRQRVGIKTERSTRSPARKCHTSPEAPCWYLYSGNSTISATKLSMEGWKLDHRRNLNFYLID